MRGWVIREGDEYSGLVLDERPSAADGGELRDALALVRSRPGAAQLVVVQRGSVVIDYAKECGADDLFWLFSASKPYVVVVLHVLAERGLIDIDAPVAQYWPEFGAHGKSDITIRQVLQHRSGFSTARGFVGDALTMTSWTLATRAIASVRPRRPAGAEPAYQVFAFGFILGEIIQRVTGRRLRDVMREELLEPLGAAHTHLGLAGASLRGVPLSGAAPGDRIVARVLNLRAVRAAVIPSAGISANARDVAAFYSMLLAGGRTAEGRQIVTAGAIQEALELSAPTEVDLYAKEHIAWANGFQLGGATTNPLPPLGRTSGARTFGHNGSNICVAWADPEQDLILVYLTSRLDADAQIHITGVSDAIAAFGARNGLSGH